MIKKLLLLSFFITGSVLTSHADSVGYVVIEQVYAKSKIIKELRDATAGNFKVQDEEVRGLFQDLQEKAKQFEKESVLMTEEERTEKQQVLLKQQQVFQQKSAELNNVVAKEIQVMQQKIEPEINRVIAKVARENDIKLVVNGILTVPVNNKPVPRNIVLYSEKEVNLTDQVIKLFDKEAIIQ